LYDNLPDLINYLQCLHNLIGESICICRVRIPSLIAKPVSKIIELLIRYGKCATKPALSTTISQLTTKGKSHMANIKVILKLIFLHSKISGIIASGIEGG